MSNVIDFKTKKPTDKHTEKYITVSVTDFNKAIENALLANYLPALTEVAKTVRAQERAKHKKPLWLFVGLYGISFYMGFVLARLV
jgi:hypothetical protein